jgi:mRNA interferase RelE/StbE
MPVSASGREKSERRMIVELSKRAAKTLSSLDIPTQGRIAAGIRVIPKGDIIKLQGHADLYRLRVGNWRIVFSYIDADKVLVETIAPRGQAYKGV